MANAESFPAGRYAWVEPQERIAAENIELFYR